MKTNFTNNKILANEQKGCFSKCNFGSSALAAQITMPRIHFDSWHTKILANDRHFLPNFTPSKVSPSLTGDYSTFGTKYKYKTSTVD